MSGTSRADLLQSRNGRIAVGVATVVVFVAMRVALWSARQPFFDELFTVWITRKSFAGILDALRYDSGPSLYYLLVKLLPSPRGVSLAAAVLAVAAMLRKRQFAAAVLLALFPPAVLFAVDGRAYALCALFVTVGVLALDDDREWLAAFAFVLAAYSHYYGVLFFPLLVRRPRTLVVALLFAPQLWLALHQPKEAMEWVDGVRYPSGLFPAIPLAALIAAGVLIALAVSRRWNVFALATLVPVAMLLAFALAGRPVYVPLRFESVLAAPLLLWVGTAVEAWPATMRRAIVVALSLVFAGVTSLGIVDHVRRPPDPFAMAVAHLPPQGEPVVASGYLYLEAAVARPDVIAFPREQALHPGWRAKGTATAADLEALPPTFVWIAERNAAELRELSLRRRVAPLYANETAFVARIE